MHHLHVFTGFVKTMSIRVHCFHKRCSSDVSHLSSGDAHTQAVHGGLLLALVDLGELPELQDVRLASSAQDPLPLPGHVLVLLPDGLQVAAGRPGDTRHAQLTLRVKTHDVM